MNLAERCFAHDNDPVHDELFEAVHEILCGHGTRGCSAPDFKFAVLDTYTDSYDSSVEIILPDYAPPMTREQADKVVALGFDLIWESQGERGAIWGTTGGSGKCQPRQARESAERRREQQIKDLKNALDVIWADAHYINLDWCKQNHETLATVVENIRKWSSKHKLL